jgi:hypothetical protein
MEVTVKFQTAEVKVLKNGFFRVKDEGKPFQARGFSHETIRQTFLWAAAREVDSKKTCRASADANTERKSNPKQKHLRLTSRSPK